MILAGHLNDLLDIFTPAQVLLIDLRSPSIFQKSHIHGAVNLRLPLNFLSIANSDLVGRTFTDEQSRRSFSKWNKSRCIVFYDRNVETPLDCPTAAALVDKLRNEGWSAQCFILKGPYREFSMSYDKYITGDRMTKEAKDYFDGIRQRAPLTDEEQRQSQTRYSEWLRRLEVEERVSAAHSFDPAEMAQRRAEAEEHQQQLAAEFKHSFPDLYGKIQGMGTPSPSPSSTRGSSRGKDNDDFYFDARKAPLVDHLCTGLDKMREASGSTARAGYSLPEERTPDKLGELPMDDFDEIDPREAQGQQWWDEQRPPYGGRSAARPAAGDGASSSSLVHKKSIWKRLRNTAK